MALISVPACPIPIHHTKLVMSHAQKTGDVLPHTPIPRQSRYPTQRTKIPANVDYKKIPSLSKEMVEKFNLIKPSTLGQALKISGVTWAAIVNVYNYMRGKSRNRL